MPRINVRVPGGEPLFDLTSYGRGGPARRDRLSPAEIALIARTVHRAPEVMVKVLTKGSNNLPAVANHVGYIGRNGTLAIETDEGEQRRHPKLAEELIEHWNLDLEDYRRQRQLSAGMGRKSVKLIHKLVLSMPAGTASEGLMRAARQFLHDEFAGKHRYAFAMHTNEPHPHVHAVVKSVSEQGNRLRIDKRTLHRWREQFAKHLRAEGIEANATPRAVRGESRKSKHDAIFRAARRGASTQIHREERALLCELSQGAIRVESGKSRLLSTRAKVEAGWSALSRRLSVEGQPALAEAVERFVRGLPPAWTDKERLAYDLRRRVQARRLQRESPSR
ncbi:relaxase/mobilization nuclease domain-containing protein [Steroidobacter flavus]|uniref:Relaxase/mobilization nuclease domain-containing protein n=1 Tax=Steroidobacter flavus TaxID=1842136 RepID=A0ABV8SXF6_9GAMM